MLSLHTSLLQMQTYLQVTNRCKIHGQPHLITMSTADRVEASNASLLHSTQCRSHTEQHDICSHCSNPITRNNLGPPGTNQLHPGNTHSSIRTQTNMDTYQASRPYTIQLPALLPGPRCYTNASTLIDHTSRQPMRAGLGVFIINTEMHPPQNIYIKGVLSDSSSVLMAEAAALALVAAVISRLQLQTQTFTSSALRFLLGSNGLAAAVISRLQLLDTNLL